MDRETLEKNLAQAEAHVAKGHERIALQHEIIAELEREGTTPCQQENCSPLSRKRKQCTSPTAIESPASWQPSTSSIRHMLAG
jgi:hypothetical protein